MGTKQPRKPMARSTQPVQTRRISTFILFPKTQQEFQPAVQVAPLVINHRIWATGKKQHQPDGIISNRANQYRPDPPAGAKPIDGKKINPYDVVSRGNRNLHASDSGIYYDGLHVNTVDCPLVSPGIPHLCDYVNTVPDESEGVYFNLYNNTWGTNFPMWYDENARFRFEITA